MKTRSYSIIMSVLLVFSLTSCEDKSSKHDPSIADGGLINHSECKNNKAAWTAEEIHDSISCVEYSWNSGTNKLNLTHINAGFNCCPGNINCDVSLIGDTIVIEESEEYALCNCNCLFDLNILVNEVSEAAYHIKIIEPYVGDQALLEFSIGLSDETEGSYCVTRTQYPWGLGLF